MKYNKIAFVAARQKQAQDALKKMQTKYGNSDPAKADVIVALGGDGYMLRTLHKFLKRNVPIFGMNRGSVGFLMNEFKVIGLKKRLEQAQAINLHPLRMKVTELNGKTREALAINEVSLLRQTRLAAKLKIKIDGKVQMEELICDGAIVATPAGSTAYNLSAHGPIIPLGADLMALTPISAFRPRQWRGALLPSDAKIEFEVLDPHERQVSVAADGTEVRKIKSVTICEDGSLKPTLLFDPEHNLEDRIVREQFLL
ncbi:MAG: NAD kinase [Rhodospirillaceae bacterium]|nr:NAD kinase [Rhodospirillaceae bacterium]